eukprot:5624579-Alexandrium_andersonii.AAC.1
MVLGITLATTEQAAQRQRQRKMPAGGFMGSDGPPAGQCAALPEFHHRSRRTRGWGWSRARR